MDPSLNPGLSPLPSPAPTGLDLSASVYAQLRELAGGIMAGERPGHTLQPTELLSEAYLKLAARAPDGWVTEAEFFSIAATAMRRILIDHARRRNAAKRGGGESGRVSEKGCEHAAIGGLGSLNLDSDEDCDRILALDEAIVRLEERDARAAEVVRLRFYAGLTVDQTALVMAQSRRTVLRDWEYARAWLLDALRPRTD